MTQRHPPAASSRGPCAAGFDLKALLHSRTPQTISISARLLAREPPKPGETEARGSIPSSAGVIGEKHCMEQQSTLLARGPEHPPAGNPAAFTQKRVNTCKYSFFSLLLALSDPFWRAPEGRSSRARPTPPIASPTPQPSTFQGTQMGQKALEQPPKKKHSTHRSCSTRSWEQTGLCPSRDKLIVAGANRVLGAAPPRGCQRMIFLLFLPLI